MAAKLQKVSFFSLAEIRVRIVDRFYDNTLQENFNLNISRDKASNRLAEEQKKIIELEQKVRELNKGIQSAQLKARSEQQRSSEKNGKLQSLTNKVRELEVQLADKTARSDVDSVIVKKMESGGQAIAMELDRQKQTNAELAHQNEELRGTCKALEEELLTTRAALEKKTNVSKQAMTDLLNNYKDSERKSMEKATECEQLKAQLQSVSAKLERIEKRRTDLEARVEESELRNADLIKKIHQYERSARMALNVAGTPTALRGGQSIVDIPRAAGSSGYGDSFSMLRTTSSSHDLSIRTSPERAVHFTDHGHDKLMDISSSMEITLRFLKERIEQLERDKAELTNDLKAQQEEMQKNLVKTKEAVGSMQALERKVQDLQNEKENLVSRLATQRQLYVSNEETMRAKELEHRGLKAKITSAELHLREKDSKISQMTGQLEALRLEISQMAGDRQRLVSSAKATEHEMKSLEDSSHAIRTERDQLAARLADMNMELKEGALATKDAPVAVNNVCEGTEGKGHYLRQLNTQGRLNEALSELEQVKRLLEDSRRQEQKQKEQVERLMYEEKHWKQAAVTAKKTSEDYHKSVYEEKITQLQHNQESLLARNDALVAEIDRLRHEQRDSANRVSLLNQKLAECERSLESTNQIRNTLSQQVLGLQKAETEWSKLEREMREELVVLRKDRLVLTSEVEELKRKLLRAEVEKKEVDGFRARLDREVASLKRHIEALEEEKARTEAAVRNTLSERKAIDKSLAAMEKENSELYRNCAQLQSQLEMVIEQREMNFTHKRKLLESQLSLVRDQLEAEKKRRLELQQRDARAGAGAGTGAGGAGPERHFSRASDLRSSRSKSIQRQKSPFRV
ncbi:M protein repeat protein [Teladorsagia circumcincta]|uniref:M protein repeat protein n=1 Tax=Teladorsagia circumcincta TaxID=45464 RepID=A0A2G9UP02_TELCI|nr:M protein repeat protein [Teladorsagia circumcincta]